jgi:hypothetical protein
MITIVTVSHHGLLNISQEYQVNTLYTPMFRLLLLSIIQLDTAGYTSTFERGKCSISSPAITITGNPVNDLYIVSPATALTSIVLSMSTKSTGRKKKTKRTSSSAYITVPSTSAHSTVPSSSAHITVPSIPHYTESTTASSLHTASPSAASTVPQSPPTTVPLTNTTRMPLTISESQLCHRCLTDINPTALRSLIDGYTQDYSMCTACI